MIDPSAAIAHLENAPSIIVPLMNEMKPENLKRRPAPGKWSAHEHACHLAHVHGFMSDRLDLMLGEENPVIQPYLPDEAEDDDFLLNKNLDEELERFTLDRMQLVERLRGLRPEQWERTADHGEYASYSVFIMFRHLAMHDMLHAYRIEELRLHPDW